MISSFAFFASASDPAVDVYGGLLRFEVEPPPVCRPATYNECDVGAPVGGHEVAPLAGQSTGKSCADDFDRARDGVDGHCNVGLGVGCPAWWQRAA